MICPRCEARPIFPGHGKLCLPCLQRELKGFGQRHDDSPAERQNVSAAGTWRAAPRTTDFDPS